MQRIYLGDDVKGNNIYWVPKKEKNPHLLVVGTSGSGKTETLKAIMHEFSGYQIPVLVIDFHQDFEDFGIVLDFKDVTINPLEYRGFETPEMVMYKVSYILKKIFNLGIQQEGALQDAIQSSYRHKGIDMKSVEEADEFPTFDDVKDELEMKLYHLKEERRSIQIIETLLVRLRPLFNTGFFSKKKDVLPFDKIFRQTTILRLKNLPTDEVKYAVAEFFLNKVKYELYERGKTDKLVLYCIVDEAHRLLGERSPLNDLLREARKYGTGVILSSQRPSDFSQTVLANMGGLLSFQCRLDKDALFVSKQTGIDYDEIRNLTEIGTAYVNFSSEKVNHKVKIRPLWKRKKSGSKERRDVSEGQTRKKISKPKNEIVEKISKEKEESKQDGRQDIDSSKNSLPASSPKTQISSNKISSNNDEKFYLERRFYLNETKLYKWFSAGFLKFFSSLKVVIVFSIILGLIVWAFLEWVVPVIILFCLFLLVLGFTETRKDECIRRKVVGV